MSGFIEGENRHQSVLFPESLDEYITGDSSMRTTNWKDVAELMGITAIVASLIFVGLQLKQSQEIAIATQYHQRAALAVENFNAQLESGDLRVWGRISGLDITPDRSVEDAGRIHLMGVTYLTMADNHFYQYQSGFMDEESWQTQRALLKRVLGTAISPPRGVLDQNIIGFRPSFIELCNTLMEENRSEADSSI